MKLYLSLSLFLLMLNSLAQADNFSAATDSPTITHSTALQDYVKMIANYQDEKNNSH